MSKQRYVSRKPGTNPRTGEMLVPWEQVQVLPPNTPAWDFFWFDARVKTEDGSRVQRIKVRAQPVVNQGPDRLYILGLLEARRLGFFPVNDAGEEIEVPS